MLQSQQEQIFFLLKIINKACEEIVKKQKIKNGYLRPFAWRGSEMMALSLIHI